MFSLVVVVGLECLLGVNVYGCWLFGGIVWVIIFVCWWGGRCRFCGFWLCVVVCFMSCLVECGDGLVFCLLFFSFWVLVVIFDWYCSF